MNINESVYKGSGQLTREQFLFFEMRITAKMMVEGWSEEEIIGTIVEENLFQFPTEKSIRSISRACINRLNALEDPALIKAISENPSDEAKQICMYAMMKRYRLLWDFMILVIGEKYRQCDFGFNKSDINAFILRLQEQDEYVAGWSESTVNKIRQVIMKILVANEYLDSNRSDHLNPVLIYPSLESAIKNSHDDIVLPAFNCFL